MVAISVSTFFWLFYSSKDYSKTKDEGIYILCANSFVKWTSVPDKFSQKNISKYWNVGYEHPSFVKILSGVSWKVFNSKTGNLLGYRMATIINFSLMIFLLYFFSYHYIGRTFAICSSVFLLCIPQVVEFAHLAEININLSLFWFLCAIFFIKGLQDKRWIYLSAVFFGLSLGSKITTIVLPIAFLIWIIIFDFKKLILPYIYFLLVGIGVFFAIWPALWFNFPGEVFNHLDFFIPQIVLRPMSPWYFVFKSFFFSIPPGLGILLAIGAIVSVIEKNELGKISLLILTLLFVIFSIPIFYTGEGIRYFLPAIPFISILCSIGLKYLMIPIFKHKIAYV